MQDAGYKFYFPYLGSAGLQLFVAQPRVSTLSQETVQHIYSLNFLLQPQGVWSVLFSLPHWVAFSTKCNGR